MNKPSLKEVKKYVNESKAIFCVYDKKMIDLESVEITQDVHDFNGDFWIDYTDKDNYKHSLKIWCRFGGFSKRVLKNPIEKITEQEFKVLQDLAKIKGINLCLCWGVDLIKSYPYIDKEDLINGNYVSGNSNINKAISFDEAIKHIASIQPSKKIALNDTYTAIVKNGFVEVGCQKISFEKIKELYEAIKK